MPTINYRNVAGERISGVTTIISANLGWNKQALMYWANQEGQAGRSHRDTAKKAADAGTIGHYLIDCEIKGHSTNVAKEYPEATTEVINKGETCLLNFLEWKEGVNLRVVKTEINLVSQRYQYGATPDCIGIINRKLALLDWKTSNGTYPDMLIQLAAYRQAWEENYPEQQLEGGFHLLRIGKEDASFHHHYWGNLQEAWETFLHLLELHKLEKLLKKKV